MGTVFDHLTSSDKDRIVKDLREQFRALKLQTQSSSTHLICNASGGPVNDPRVPWVAQENPRTFARYQDFAAEVWTGLDWSMNRDTLRPMMMPLIERKDVPIVFSHADLLPKNIIIPGGLARWRAGAAEFVSSTGSMLAGCQFIGMH
ncbi:hypothetical protein A0H81_07937 [Grifola frondosa]|uniref:Aminoglycoside phosphotransferase domain-containing protein n=1 Tax=Grifola frondosa TaxID=5627 RepID=A0A1C7M7Q2_GRIFR|nr:hypothetical protein A0H81_07937 [Grifola frondosa]